MAASRRGIPLLAAMTPDTAAGRAQFTTRCAACHGMDGQVTPSGPPLWGPKSFNIGASNGTASYGASFIKYNIRNDRPGTLTAQQAFDLARVYELALAGGSGGQGERLAEGDGPSDVPYCTKGRAGGP